MAVRPHGCASGVRALPLGSVVPPAGGSSLLIQSRCEALLSCFSFLAVMEKSQENFGYSFCVKIGFHFTWVSPEKWDLWFE